MPALPALMCAQVVNTLGGQLLQTDPTTDYTQMTHLIAGLHSCLVAGWLAGWLVGWLAGWLAGCVVIALAWVGLGLAWRDVAGKPMRSEKIIVAIVSRKWCEPAASLESAQTSSIDCLVWVQGSQGILP